MRGVCLAVLICLGSGCDCYSVRRGAGDDGRGPELLDGAVDLDASHDAAASRDAGTADGGIEPSDNPGPVRIDHDSWAAAPQVAMDSAGNATVVWSQSDGVVARRWEPPIGWRDIASLGQWSMPSIDFNARGDGVVVWNDGDRTHARIWAPGVGWLVDEDIGVGRVEAAVAIDGSGTAVCLLGFGPRELGQAVHSTTYDGGGWSTSVLVDDGGVEPSLSANEAGDFVALWARGGVSDSLWTSRLSEGVWGPPIELGQGRGLARASVGGTGDAFAVWAAEDGVWTASGPLGEVELDPDYLSSRDVDATMVAVSGAADGSAFVAWVDGFGALASRAEPGGGFGDVTRLGGPEGPIAPFEAIEVAADGIGGATVVWSQEDAGRLGVWSARYVAGEGWRDAVRVDPSSEGNASWPDVDVAPDGTAAIVWNLQTDATSELWAAIIAPAP